MTELNCPICKEELTSAPIGRPNKDAIDYPCQNCGVFSLTRSAEAILSARQMEPKQLAALSHAIRRLERKDDRPLITSTFAESILNDPRLPGIEEQLENLVLFLGRTLPEPGATLDLSANNLRALLGSISVSAAGWVMEQAEAIGLLQGTKAKSMSGPVQMLRATLSIRGWDTFNKLIKDGSQSRRAFMAMKFGDETLNLVFSNHFRPACKTAGFDLLKLDDDPRAGLIDDRLRVEIRRSRFLLADLTHGNPGAYWEAGFAEGLGRPVIYTCRKDVFENPSTKPHFDTNHHLTIVWDPASPTESAKNLTATIRATLPSEATFG